MYEKASKQALPVDVGGLYHGSNGFHVVYLFSCNPELCPNEKGNRYPTSFLKIHVTLIVLRYYVTLQFVQWSPPITYM